MKIYGMSRNTRRKLVVESVEAREAATAYIAEERMSAFGYLTRIPKETACFTAEEAILREKKMISCKMSQFAADLAELEELEIIHGGRL